MHTRRYAGMKIGPALLAWGALAVNPVYSSAPATAPGALKTSARQVGQSHAAAICVAFIDIKVKHPTHLRRSAIATIYCSSTIAAMENRLRCNATLRPRQLGRRRFERRTCRARLSEARAVWRIVRYDVLSGLRSSPSGDRRERCPRGRRSAAFLHPPTADGARSADGNRPARTSMRPRSNLLRALLPFRRPFCGVGAALQRWSDQPRRYRVTSLRRRVDRQIVKNRAASVRRFRGLRETLGRRCSYFLLGSSAGLT